MKNARTADDSEPNGKVGLPRALGFGLGAGLYFEYRKNTHTSPSRTICGANRKFSTNLERRLDAFGNGTARQSVKEALRENALLFNLDRAPTVALMGMELLAEELTGFTEIGDWQASLASMRAEIVKTGSLHRRLYLNFLQEVALHFPTHSLQVELGDVADEWDALAVQLSRAEQDVSQLEPASRMLCKIASREEHFWGHVLDL